MKLALLSDVHANQQALQACLAHALDQGAQRVAVLGDLGGYGGNPTQVMEQVMGLAAEGAIVLQGNHDEMAVQPPTDKTTLGTSTADWTHAQLSPEHRSFLAGLPLTAQVQHLQLVHASADQPAKWRYVDSERAASQFGLHIVHHAIQDEAFNRTRFAVIALPQTLATPPASGKDCTSLVVSVPNRPGAVHDMLVPLKQHGIALGD